MNYRRIYNELIMRGWRRTNLYGYCEKHHIIPKCIGGGNEVSNIVKLTAEEHFIAHLLLTRMYPDEYKLARAVIFMKDRNKGFTARNNKMFGELRRKAAIQNSISSKRENLSPETRKRMSEGCKLRVRSKETILKIAQSKKGSKLSTKAKENMSKAQKLRHKLNPLSPESKLKISMANKGRKHTEETRKNMSEAGKRRAPITEETRLKLSEALKKRVRKPVSDETKKKISETLKGRPSPKKGTKLSEEARVALLGIGKGRKASDETKEKLRLAGLNRIHSEESKKKMSKAQKLRPPVSKETRKNMSEAGKRRAPITEETRAKISANSKIMWQNKRDRKEILQFWCAL